MEFFNTLREVKNNWNPYKKWETEQKTKEEQDKELRKKYPPSPEELEHANQYGRTIVDSINIMDQHSIDKSEDAAYMVKNAKTIMGLTSIPLGCFLGSLSLLSKKVRNKLELALYFQAIGAIATTMIASIIGNIWGASIEKQASRIARYQTRENELKDSRNFVIYTKEQINEAKEIEKTLPEISEKRKDLTLKKSLNPIATFKKAKETTDGLRKDYDIYKEWKEKYLKEEKEKKIKFEQMNPSQEDLSKAQKDRNVLLNTIKKIEYSSLNYMMDMKLAVLTVASLLLSAGMALSFATVKLMDYLQKNKKLANDSLGINIAKAAELKFIPVIILLLVIGPVIKLTKDAARIGRYKAKQEMLSDPANFISYDDKTRNEIKIPECVNAKEKSFVEKFKQDIRILKQFKKDYNEYHNYMNTEYKEELKLKEALKKINISSEQEANAIYLQKNAFHSFEKMDEKAQRYTDDTEAGVDILLHIISSISTGAARIFSISILLKKLREHEKNDIKSIKDITKALKYFKGSDLIKIALPILAPLLINIPLGIKGIQIKKEAGKIGVMQAINDLEDPKNFINDSDS